VTVQLHMIVASVYALSIDHVLFCVLSYSNNDNNNNNNNNNK